MSDERMDGLHADMQLQFATVNTTLGDLRRLIQSSTDDVRRRVTIAETTIINELRDLSARFDRVEERLTRLEAS